MNFHFDECCNRYPKFSKLVKVKHISSQHAHYAYFILRSLRSCQDAKI